MPAATKAVRKMRQVEKQIKDVETKIQGKLSKILEPNGPADELAHAIDQATAEAIKDFERITEKWTSKIKKLGDSFREQAKKAGKIGSR
jgi:peptidoglycan hydrolase CwlO-like protein